MIQKQHDLFYNTLKCYMFMHDVHNYGFTRCLSKSDCVTDQCFSLTRFLWEL